MGTTLSGIHIHSDLPIEGIHLDFVSFSDGWQTCVSDLSAEPYTHILAQKISKQVSAPVLCFSIVESESIEFYFYQNGKCAARYFDDTLRANKNLYGIPALIGWGDGGRRRLSHILACADAAEKTAMLEEYFGVCLLFHPALADQPQALRRTRGDVLYRDYAERDKQLTGKRAPIRAELVAEFDGKLFQSRFGDMESYKKHCYLKGYEQETTRLTPVRFAGGRLEEISEADFMCDREPKTTENPFFDFQYTVPVRITFRPTCPVSYVGKTWTLPGNFMPFGFDEKERLILTAGKRVMFMDADFQVLTKLSLRDELTDMADGYFLTTGPSSFYAYCYDPGEKIRIYRVVDKR